MLDLNNLRLRAHRAFVDGGVLENPLIEIQKGIVRQISKSNTPNDQAVDLGPVTLIPGLINAHTHLEFSHLQRPLGNPGLAFTDWIQLVIGERASRSPRDKSASIQTGLRESYRAGVVAMGEIASWPSEPKDYHGTLTCVVFLERLGFDTSHFEDLIKEAECWTQSAEPNLVAAISPHAPYSVHPRLLEKILTMAKRNRLPVSTHLAESLAELQWLREGTGPFVDLFESMHLLEKASVVVGTSVSQYLAALSKTDRALIIHGNYLSESEIDLVAQHRQQLSIVYCPRTQHYFQHDPYPLLKLLKAKIIVAVGTDSRASNPDLNLFRELQFIHRRYPTIDQRTILEMGTNHGAQALGLTATYGSIKEGGPANLNVVQIEPGQGLFGVSSRCTPLSEYLADRVDGVDSPTA